MKCFEAQSYIMPFINDKVPETKQEEFVMHIKACPRCHEELEIYYILLKGMDQLNNEKKLSTDFSKDLETDLNRLVTKSKGRKTAKFSVFSIVITVMIFFMAIFYGDCINRVYAFEQDSKWEAQGNYYFAERLADEIMDFDIDRVRDEKEKDLEKEVVISMYEKARAFQLVEENQTYILSVRERMNCGKIIIDRWK